MVFVWVFVVLVMALVWWLDRSRYGTVLRAVGDDELAAQSVGINLTATKVSAMTSGARSPAWQGGLYAHYTTHIEHLAFGVVQSIFALAYPDHRRTVERLRHARGRDLRARAFSSRDCAISATGGTCCSAR
jgi:hypothetical protein